MKRCDNKTERSTEKKKKTITKQEEILEPNNIITEIKKQTDNQKAQRLSIAELVWQKNLNSKTDWVE